MAITKKTMNLRLQTSLILTLLLLMTGTISYSQPARGERVRALRTAYITDRINLSSSQAERFWPIYNAYEAELRTTRQSFLKQYRGQNRHRSEAEARRFVDDNLDYQEALVALKRKYQDDYLKVISANQLADLYAAEREFRQILIQKLRERRSRR